MAGKDAAGLNWLFGALWRTERTEPKFCRADTGTWTNGFHFGRLKTRSRVSR